MGAERFEIHVAEEVLDDLRTRLGRARWTSVPRDVGESGWQIGTSGPYLQDLCEVWRTSYDWRRQEAALNALAQWKARVGPAHLHFVHVQGRGPRTMPLLLLHGWPDSFHRYHHVIPRLADPAAVGGSTADAFDVVVPSLPGFAFTGLVPLAPHQPTRQSAQLLWRLMTEVLGYRRFAVAGGDGGSVLAQILAIDHPESVVGIHLTDLGWHVASVDRSRLSREEQSYLDASRKVFLSDGAYALVQTTRPRTLAPALTDSPVALASWIADRFHAWSDAADQESGLDRDDLLTTITLHWVTGSIGPSMFNYYADARSPSLTPSDHVDRPVAMALFPRDVGGVPPRVLAERTLNVQRWTEMPRGGHFAALEEPELYALDLIEFFRPLRALATDVKLERSDVHPTV